MTEDGIDINQ